MSRKRKLIDEIIRFESLIKYELDDLDYDKASEQALADIGEVLKQAGMEINSIKQRR